MENTIYHFQVKSAHKVGSVRLKQSPSVIIKTAQKPDLFGDVRDSQNPTLLQIDAQQPTVISRRNSDCVDY